MPKKYTEEEATQIIKNKCGSKYTFLGFNTKSKTYEGKNSRLILKCNKCDKVLSYVWFSSLVSDRIFHHCKKKELNKNELEEITIQKIQKALPSDFEFISIDGEYEIASKTKFFVKCKKCNSVFSYTYAQLMYSKKAKFTCKKCGLFWRSDEDLLKQKISEICEDHNFNFLGFLENEYQSKRKTHVILQCKKCGTIWRSCSVERFLTKTPKCLECEQKIWKLEKEVKLILENQNIEFIEQKQFPWLKYKNNLLLDYFIPSKNIAIECQGKEHFEPTIRYGGEEGFNIIRERDVCKKELCEKHGIKLLYYASDTKEKCFLNENIIKNKKDLLEKILNG